MRARFYYVIRQRREMRSINENYYMEATIIHWLFSHTPTCGEMREAEKREKPSIYESEFLENRRISVLAWWYEGNGIYRVANITQTQYKTYRRSWSLIIIFFVCGWGWSCLLIRLSGYPVGSLSAIFKKIIGSWIKLAKTDYMLLQWICSPLYRVCE